MCGILDAAGAANGLPPSILRLHAGLMSTWTYTWYLLTDDCCCISCQDLCMHACAAALQEFFMANKDYTKSQSIGYRLQSQINLQVKVCIL